MRCYRREATRCCSGSLTRGRSVQHGLSDKRCIRLACNLSTNSRIESSSHVVHPKEKKIKGEKVRR